MMKEHERRERLKSMSEEERRREEQHYEEMKTKHAEHPKVNHPVRLRKFIQANYYCLNTEGRITLITALHSEHVLNYFFYRKLLLNAHGQNMSLCLCVFAGQ